MHTQTQKEGKRKERNKERKKERERERKREKYKFIIEIRSYIFQSLLTLSTKCPRWYDRYDLSPKRAAGHSPHCPNVAHMHVSISMHVCTHIYTYIHIHIYIYIAHVVSHGLYICLWCGTNSVYAHTIVYHKFHTSTRSRGPHHPGPPVHARPREE